MAFYLVTFCCVFVALGSFLFGYDAGVIASSIEQTAFRDRFGHLSDAATGGIVSSYTGEYSICNSGIRNRDLIRIIRWRYCGLSPRSIHFRLLWPPNVNFCRRSAGHAGCCASGRCSDYPDADRWSIHRGCSNWSNVCYYSRVLCMCSSSNPLSCI